MPDLLGPEAAERVRPLYTLLVPWEAEMESVSHPISFSGFSVGDRVMFRRHGKEVWVIESITMTTGEKQIPGAGLRREGVSPWLVFLDDLQQVT